MEISDIISGVGNTVGNIGSAVDAGLNKSHIFFGDDAVTSSQQQSMIGESTPAPNKPTPSSVSISSIGSSVGMLGGLYFAYHKKSGVWGYIGYAILFSACGSIAGSIAEKTFGSTKAINKSIGQPSSSSSYGIGTAESALDSALPAIAVKLKYGMGQSTSDLRSKILAYANSYVGASKDYFIELMNMVKKTASLPQNDPSSLTAVMNALNDLQKNLKAKGYSDTEIQNAATQVGKDMAQFKFNR